MLPFFKPKDEEIMVISRKTLFGEHDQGSFQGFIRIEDPRAKQFLATILENHHFVWRKLPTKEQKIPAEEDISLKQIIPYCVIKSGDSYFCYKRLGKTTEKRLVDKFSLGIGGHINPLSYKQLDRMVSKLPHEMNDSLLENTIIEHNMLRELHEEVSIGNFTYKPLGFINDDATDVGKHHLGILYVIELEKPIIKSKEKDKIEGRLMTVVEIEQQNGEPEGWSGIVLERIKMGFI